MCYSEKEGTDFFLPKITERKACACFLPWLPPKHPCPAIYFCPQKLRDTYVHVKKTPRAESHVIFLCCSQSHLPSSSCSHPLPHPVVSSKSKNASIFLISHHGVLQAPKNYLSSLSLDLLRSRLLLSMAEEKSTGKGLLFAEKLRVPHGRARAETWALLLWPASPSIWRCVSIWSYQDLASLGLHVEKDSSGCLRCAETIV